MCSFAHNSSHQEGFQHLPVETMRGVALECTSATSTLDKTTKALAVLFVTHDQLFLYPVWSYEQKLPNGSCLRLGTFVVNAFTSAE